MRASSRSMRWTLLATTAAMAAVLLGTGLWSYTTARDSARSLARSQAVSAAVSARRALRLAGRPDAEALREILDEGQTAGLTYLAIVDGSGNVTAAVGEAAPPACWLSPVHGLAGPVLQTARAGFDVRVTSPLTAGPGRGWRRMGLDRDPGGFDHGPWHGLRGPRLIVELQSPAAEILASRARLALGANSIAAAVLLALAGMLWRMSRRAEASEALLARDRQLKSLGQMSAVLGHELRNPLTSLKGHVQLLLERLPADHPGRRGAETVLRETVRLEELARQVLEFARTGAVRPALEDPVATARAAAESAGGGRIEVAVQGEAQPCMLDRALMEGVLVNLLRNAVEASPEGLPVKLTVAVRPGTELVLEVRDHGEGIVPGEEERVFEPFYTRRTRGTGLGLALARRIVEGHDGRIVAGNHPDGGAVFRITLPWRQEAAA